MTMPMSSGNQPPSMIFKALAPKNIRSMKKNTPVAAMHSGRLMCQAKRITKKVMMVVISMSSATVMP